MPETESNVAIFDRKSPTSGIQAAIDALGDRGGQVRIPAREWRLRRALVLSNRVSLIGDGPATVLTIARPKVCALARSARKGSCSVTLDGKVPFKLGDEVGLFDGPGRGWHGTHGLVTSVEGNVVRLSEPLNYGLALKNDAVITSLFPAIMAKDSRHLEVRDLAIRGPGRRGRRWDFTYTAVHFHGCRHIRVLNVTVSEWPSDGIGVQAGSDAQVAHCQVTDCRGNGFHPGTSLGRSVWSHNIGTRNGGDGFFFCWEVHDTVCSDNVFTDNAQSGIGGVGDVRDHHNIISNNVCSNNARWGIDAFDGDEHMITGNLLRNNSHQKAGAFAAVRLHNARRFLVQGNRCDDDQKRPTQTRGIIESGDSDWNLVSQNLCIRTAEPIVIVGPNSRAEGNLA